MVLRPETHYEQSWLGGFSRCYVVLELFLFEEQELSSSLNFKDLTLGNISYGINLKSCLNPG